MSTIAEPPITQPTFEAEATHVTVRRAVAQMLDSALLLMLSLYFARADRGVGGLVMLVFFFAYFGWLQGATGWTLGKLVLGVRVVDRNGDPPGLVASIKRSLTLLVQFLGAVALTLMLRSPWRQRAGDRWADTYVVDRTTAN